LDRIRPALDECEAPDEEVLEAQGLEAKERRRDTGTRAALAAMAILASLAGALVTILPNIGKLNFLNLELVKGFLGTVVGSLAVIAAFAVVYKFRISQEAVPTRATEVDESARFEEEVALALRRLGASLDHIPAGGAGDLLAELDGRKYLVEIKARTSRRLPAAMIRSLSERLSKTADQIGAHETLFVTKSPVVGLASTAAVPRVH
jgi:hypothetical protein